MRITSLLLMTVAAFALSTAAARAQDDPDPELHQLKGVFECTVQQTADGDVLHLNCTETESPLSLDFDIELYKVTVGEYSTSRTTLWLRANTNMARHRLILSYKHTSEPTYVDVEEVVGYDERSQGETWTSTVYPDFTWTSVEIAVDPGYGWTCKGCGTYVHGDVPVAAAVDPTSIRPEDVGRFLQEMQNIVMPRRR